MRFSKGEIVWFDAGNGQEPGRVVEYSTSSDNNTSVTVVQTQVSAGVQPRMFRLDDLSCIKKRDGIGRQTSGGKTSGNPRQPWFDEETGIDDMIELSDLNEENILQNLRLRFGHNVIYTSIGSILVAVNPYKMFPEKYSLDIVKLYENYSRLSELPPHLFAVGSTSFFQMNKEHEDQVVIISGESGAGKTESTKLIMQYLAAVNRSASNLVTEQILEATPLLESFGNAKTIRNDNSSRFGKYLAIFFDKDGAITGAKITEYLLEKSRICTHAEDERNYHVFYELLAGLTKDEKLVYGLQEEKNYYYLNQGGDSKMVTKNDAGDFQELKSAMQVLNFSISERETVFKILASVLHIGNIRFKANQVEYQAEGVVVERDSEVRWIAHLLQIPDTGIVSALTTKTTEARNEKLLTPLNRDQAFDARDAIAKALYSRLFTWLVDRTNQIVAQNQNRNTSIALLDIFGFEDFKENSFEQLCINYANETLQFYFNQHIFKLEQQEYAKEKIVWQQIEFVDNQPVLDLIAKKPVGILHILDDESSFPKATDASFLEKCHYNHGTNNLYQRPRTLHPSFAIKHYAGQVSYTVHGFLDKNRDTLRADVIELFISSGMPMVSKMFQEWKDSSDFVKTVKRGAGRFVTMKPRTPTVSARFQESLTLLVENMSKCRPHFVRCIKPNVNKAPMLFENKIVLDQLKYTGMLETIRIRKIGYPVRIKFNHFVEQYRCLLRKRKLPSGVSAKDSCRSIFDVFYEFRRETPSSSFKSKLLPEYQLGNSKVFMRESLHQKLEQDRSKVLGEAASVIQRHIRGHFQRKKYKEEQKAAVKIQAVYRGYRQRKKYKKVKTGITRAQANIRMHQQRKRYLETTNRTKQLQAMDAPRRNKNIKKAEQQQKAHAAADGVKNPQLPGEISFIFNKLDEWQAPHSERNVIKVIGHIEPPKEKYRPILPKDIDSHSFQKFSGVYCKNRVWGPRREPIQEPFLTSLSEFEKREALDVFRLVLKFMHDSNLNEKKEKALADYIVHKGITNERLRDEIYCQLCNQTWPPELLHNSRNSLNLSPSSTVSSPDIASIERAWCLLAHCLGAFPPSATLYKYLLKYVSDHAIDNYKFTCQSRLLQCQSADPRLCRIYPPSLLEMKTSRKNAQMAVDVVFADSERRTGPVTSWTTAAEFAKNLLLQRDVIAESNGWTAQLVTENGQDLIELNGSDYFLDLVSELELPPSFPVVKPAFLYSRSRRDRRRSDSEFVGKMDFGDEDDSDPQLRTTPRDSSADRADQMVTRLGLAKNSKLNQRYEVDKQDLAKNSALNKRYILTEADVAVRAENNSKAKDHPGLSNSELNRRYRSTQSMAESESDTTVPDSPTDSSLSGRSKHATPSHASREAAKEARQRNAPSVSASDAHSLTSHFQRVRVPSSSSNARDIDSYLDQIFDPVLRTGNYADDDESVVRLDAKKLAASIKGGGSKPTKNPTEPGFRSSNANHSSQQPQFGYSNSSVPPVMPGHHIPQYGLPLGAQIQPGGLTSLGYYPQLAGVPPQMLYDYPHAYHPNFLARTHSVESVMSASANRSVWRETGPLYPHLPYGSQDVLSSRTGPVGYGQMIVPTAAPAMDPVFYLQQQNYAAQMQLQHQLATALQQNFELQQKILQNQQEIISVHQHQRITGGDSDGVDSLGASPDSLPISPTGNERYVFKDRPRQMGEAVRSTTPLPTTTSHSATRPDSDPPLPPRKYEPPPKQKTSRPPQTSNIPPPPPPPPPPPRIMSPDSKRKEPFSEQIAGRANTVRIANVRWPPPKPILVHDDEAPNFPLRPSPNRFAISQELGGPGESKELETMTSKKLTIDPAMRSRLENVIVGQTLKQKPKTHEVKNQRQVVAENPSVFARPTPKPIVFDAKGIPFPPPLPPSLTSGNMVNGDDRPPQLPPRAEGMKLPVEVHPVPSRLSPHVEVGVGKRAAFQAPASSTYYAYNRTHWNIVLRKEFFTPTEKIDNPLVINLIFAQIRQDTFNEFCVRMNQEEQLKMRTLFESYGISRLDSGLQPAQNVKGAVKRNVIDAAKELPLYFSRLYSVATDKSSSSARRQYLAVSHTGLRLVYVEKDRDSQEVLRVGEYRGFDQILETSIPRNSALEISFAQADVAASSKAQAQLSWILYTHKVTGGFFQSNQIKELIDQMCREADQITGGGSVGELVRAVSDYRTKDPNLLSFRRGDIIKLATRNQPDKGWLYGNIGDRWGLFPSEYVVGLNRQEVYHIKSSNPGLANSTDTGYFLKPRFHSADSSKPERPEKMKNGGHDSARETSSSTSSQKSSSPETAAIASRAHDGKLNLTMVEFAVLNFRQSIEKYGVVNHSRRDSNASSIQGSIKQIEKLKNAGGKEWTWNEQVQMVKFSRSPIHHSLLQFDEPELDKVAVDVFTSIMRFMGDYPMSAKHSEVECVYMVLMVCHKYPALRDEVYCQIIKQTTNNKSLKPDSCQRGWRFFSIIAAYFDCSENLRPYMFKYLETAAYDKRRPYHGTALVCLQNLRKTFKFGGRKNVPSVDEIAAISAGRSSKRQIYLLPGGTEKVLNTKSTTIVEDVILELCNQLKIDATSEMEEYSVYALRDKDDLYGVPLQYEDYILDVSTELLKTSANFLLLFRRSVWYFPLRTSEVANSVYIDMMFHQVVPDYLDGLLLVAPPGGLLAQEIGDLCKLAALLHRSTDKQVPPDMKETKYLLPRPALTLRDPRPPQWLQMVHDCFQVVAKLSPIEAKTKFLEMLQKWTLFGSSFYFVNRVVATVPEGHPHNSNSASSGSSSESPSKRIDKSLVENILAINKNGIFFLDAETRQTVDHYSFPEIISTRRIKSSEDGALYLDMKVGNLMSPKITRMQTLQAHEIARLIGHYIHVENEVHAMKSARNNLSAEILQQSIENGDVPNQE